MILGMDGMTIEGVKPFKKGDKVRWIKGSRLAGVTGVVTGSGPVETFVYKRSSGRTEHTRTALLEPFDGVGPFDGDLNE
jgi:hypothetical protein